MERKLIKKDIKVIYFNSQDYELLPVDSLEEIERKENYNCWINIRDNTFESYINVLKNKFGIHHLALEDIEKGSERTKIEQFDDFKFIILHPVKGEDLTDKLVGYDDVYIILMKEFIITFTNSKNDVFYNLIENMYININHLENTTNKLNFVIMESIVDNYYTNFEKMEEEVNKIELDLMKYDNYQIIDELYLLRRNIIYMNKNITPFKSIVKYIYESSDIEKVKDITYYYRDLDDDIDNIIERIEVYKELTTNIIDIVNNKVSNRTNQITTVLTVWSTIFLPITFLTGVFGMNFRYMNALEWKLAYPIFWIVSIIMVLMMIIFFKRKKWF